MPATYLQLITQPSSCAGFAAIGSLVAAIIATTGIPTTAMGWAACAVPVLAGIAAIIRDDGSSITTPQV
jgi:hypothetical protein